MNVLPRGVLPGIGTPTVEEVKTYTIQLGDLSQEANVVNTQVHMSFAKMTRTFGKQDTVLAL